MAKEFKKALNAYLFNVEYGYVYDRECKTNMLGITSSDKYFQANDKEIRNQNNLLPMEELSKDRKKSLKEELVKKIENRDSWLPKLYGPEYPVEGKMIGNEEEIVKYVAEQIDAIEKKKVKIPYYCTKTDKYTKIGTYTASIDGLLELLYVTELEEKLYDLEQILREKLKFSKPTDYWYTTTLYFTYNFTYSFYGTETYSPENNGKQKKFFTPNLKIVYDERNRKDWVNTEQQRKRNKFYEERAKLGNWAPLTRWKATFEEIVRDRARKIVKEIEEIEIKNNPFKDAFNKQAEAAGWGTVRIDEKKKLDRTFYDAGSRHDIGYYFAAKWPEKTMKQLESMLNFLLGENKFNLKTTKMDVNIKDLLGENVIRYTYDKIVKNVDYNWIVGHQNWVKERGDKFVGPMTVKEKDDGSIEFFGGTLIKGLTCKRCVATHGTEYSFNKPLDIMSYKIGDYHVLKNLIPENLLEKAVVRKIVGKFIREKKLRPRNPNYRGPSMDDEHDTTIPKKPDPSKYKQPLKL